MIHMEEVRRAVRLTQRTIISGRDYVVFTWGWQYELNFKKMRSTNCYDMQRM
jgi:hypothetical protein